jgi:hypothetical protein
MDFLTREEKLKHFEKNGTKQVLELNLLFALWA